MKDGITVLHARDIKKALPIVAGRPFGWLYLGQGIRQRENISRVLGRENRRFTGDLLRQVAYQEKQPFLDFIADLGLQQKNKLHWWASNTAYRNPYLARDLFLPWCYDVVFEKVCLERKDGERALLVFVENRWLYRHLWERHRKEKSGFHFLSRKSVLPEMLKSVLRGVAGRAYVLLVATYHAWRSRSISSGDNSGGGENEKKVYLYSWVQDRFFGQNGKFNDAYFGRLPDILTGDGLNVSYITPLFLSHALKKKCQDGGEYDFTFLDRYINFGDILKCLFIRFPISYDGKQRWVETLLRRQTVNEISSIPTHLLYYLAFRRWLKATSQEKITIIYPFENQPWEKMLCMAAKESGKNIRLVAYQHSSVPPLFLCYFLGAGESKYMPLPDIIVANGEYPLELFNGAGYGKIEFINGGALRYEHLQGMERGSSKQGRKQKIVLVALPYIATLAEEMLLAASDAFKDAGEENIEVIIKTHPIEHSKRLADYPLPLPAHFQQTDKPIPEILKESDLLIYAASATGLEAVLTGVPVVKFCSEHIIDLDSLDVDGRAVRSCFENDMKEVVLGALSEMGNLTWQPAENLNKFFSPVDEDVWKQIVAPDSTPS